MIVKDSAIGHGYIAILRPTEYGVEVLCILDPGELPKLKEAIAAYEAVRVEEGSPAEAGPGTGEAAPPSPGALEPAGPGTVVVLATAGAEEAPGEAAPSGPEQATAEDPPEAIRAPEARFRSVPDLRKSGRPGS